MTPAPRIHRILAAVAASSLLTLTLALVAGGCAGNTDVAGSPQPSGRAPNSNAGPERAAPSPEEASFAAGEHRPPTARTLFSMARILETQGKDSEAEYVLRTIITQHPAFMPAYCDLAEALLRQRRIDEAVHTLKVGLAHAQSPEPILINDLGMCQLLRDDPAGALPYFTRAAAMAPDDARYRGNMAVALGLAGRYAEALALYTQVMPIADAHYNLGVLCAARHDQVRAAQEFRLAQIATASPATLPSAHSATTEQPPPNRADPAPVAPSRSTQPTG